MNLRNKKKWGFSMFQWWFISCPKLTAGMWFIPMEQSQKIDQVLDIFWTISKENTNFCGKYYKLRWWKFSSEHLLDYCSYTTFVENCPLDVFVCVIYCPTIESCEVENMHCVLPPPNDKEDCPGKGWSNSSLIFCVILHRM